MDFRHTEEQLAFYKSVKDFAARVVEPGAHVQGGVVPPGGVGELEGAELHRIAGRSFEGTPKQQAGMAVRSWISAGGV